MTPDAPIDPLTRWSAARFGVYIHFPYCVSKCPYCDFASTAAKEVPEARYAKAIVRELQQRLEAFGVSGRQVHSVFFGGGTPSLWHPRYVGEVLEALGARLSLAPRAEVTLEANPGAADAERFSGFRAAGVNRLSMGVQSFHLQTLKTLGRSHDGAQAHRAFEAARAAGFDNVSMDFIYGVHGQTLAQVEADAREAVAMGAEHLSAYALTLDRDSLAEEVPLAKQLARGEVTLPDDEVVISMQRIVRDVFLSAGLQRYEVSNYAKPGHHSRHNSLYWTGGDYLALGVGATGCITHDGATVRYSNQRSAEKYLHLLEAGDDVTTSREPLSTEALFSERIAMGLRLTHGIDVEQTCAHFGQSLGPRALVIRHLVNTGFAEQREGRLALTDKGFDVHSAIAAQLM